jgi:ubiquitin-protein ligase
VLDINAVIYGVIYLFYEPNGSDPLNKEAAELFRSDKAQVNNRYLFYTYVHTLTYYM